MNADDRYELALKKGQPFHDYCEFLTDPRSARRWREYFDEKHQWWRAIYDKKEWTLFKLIGDNYMAEVRVDGSILNKCLTIHKKYLDEFGDKNWWCMDFNDN